MTTREEALAELYSRGALNAQQKSAVEELARRGVIKLPESIDQQIMRAQQDSAYSELAKDQNMLEAGLISIGRGFTNVARGVGLVGDESEAEKAAWGALKKERPITTTVGEVAGEVAPFLPLGVATSAIKALAPRVAASAGVGALEAGIPSLGRSGDSQQAVEDAGLGAIIGGGIEAAMPKLGRIGRAIYRKVKGEPPAGALFDAAGNPTPEMADALNKAGVSMSDLQQEVMRDIMDLPAGSSPEQAARIAAFKQEGIPYTKGDITQDLPQQAMEARLAESASDPIAQPMRTARIEQSEKFRESLDSMLSRSGIPERSGESIKDALSGRKELMRKEKSDLYKNATHQARDVGGVPVINDNIKAAIPSADLEDLAVTAPSAISSLNGILVKYGLKEPAENYKGTITPLSIENAERFRKSLNVIERSDQTGAVKVATGPIKSALDDELDLMVSSAGSSIPSELLTSLKEGRSIVRKMKTEFSPQSMAGRLIDVKRDGVTPVIEASTISRRLLGPAGTIEDVKRVMSSLGQSGEKGAQAIGDLQSSAIMELIEAGFGATSRKIDGTSVLSPAAFQKGIKKIGDAKLNLIFSNNKDTLNKIKNLGRIAGNIQAQAGAIPKGSASVILDSLQKLGILGVSSKIPGMGLFIDVIDTAAKNKGTKDAVRSALDARPDVKKVAIEINRKYPLLAQTLGISAIRDDSDENAD
ncbi:MAG: hypothetical protein ACRCXB_08750 [Aeromonadaceae bacterium]